VTAGVDIELQDVGKRYATAADVIDALAGVTLRIHAGDSVAITGPSGCGKSTLLGLIAGLDVPSEGTVTIDGTVISSLGADQRAAIRRRDIGLIFQSDNLLPFLTAQENVRVQRALRADHPNGETTREELTRAGLRDELDRVPDELSGGQRQRVAVVRARAGRPRLIVGDEPTGSLDPATADALVDLVLEATAASRATLVVVTHERSLAERMGRIITLRDGRVVADESHGAP
jgi:putative ABC transport system ATP-binding protein